MKQETPIVDLRIIGSSIGVNAIQDKELVIRELHDGLKKLGFVHLINHGIPQEKIDRAFEVSKEFFSLSESAKRKTKYSTSTLVGHVDYGDRFVKRHGEREHRESYDRALSKGDYPTEIPEFRTVTDTLMGDLVQLARLVMELIAEALGLPLDSFTNAVKKLYSEDNNTVLRMLHYPPMTNIDEEITRCGPHTDYDAITLILQDDVGGLKVQGDNDTWVDVKPVPGAVLMNLGELFEIWTGGELKATVHAVTRPTDPVLLSRSRYSIAFFVMTDHGAMIRPLVGDQNKYEAVEGRTYVINKLKQWYS